MVYAAFGLSLLNTFFWCMTIGSVLWRRAKNSKKLYFKEFK